MTKKLLIALVGVGLVLGGCLNPCDDLENKKIEKIEFDMNNKCATLKEEIEEFVCKTGTCWIDEVFYSPKTKSCLYVQNASTITEEGDHKSYQFLIDVRHNMVESRSDDYLEIQYEHENKHYLAEDFINAVDSYR